MFKGKTSKIFCAVLLCMAMMASSVLASVGVVNYENSMGVNAPVAGGFSTSVDTDEDAVLVSAAYDKNGVLVGMSVSGEKVGDTLTTDTLNLDTLDGVTIKSYIWNGKDMIMPLTAVQEPNKITLDAALIDGVAEILWNDNAVIADKTGYKILQNGTALDAVYGSNAAKASVNSFYEGDKVRVAAVNSNGEILTASNEITLGANINKPVGPDLTADFSEYTGVFNPTSEDELSTARWDGMVRTTVGPVKAGWDVAVYRGNTMKYTESGTTISHPNDGWSYNVPAKSWYDGTEDQHDNAGVWYWDDAEKAIYTHAYYRGTKTKIDYYDRAELWLNLGEMYENGDDILLTFEYKGGLRKIRSEHPGSSTLNNENNWATSIEFGTGNNGKTSNDWRPVTAYLPNLAINSTGPTSKEGGKGDIWLYGGMDGFWIKNIKVINITKAREAGLKYAELDMENSPIEFADDKENGVVVTYNDDYESAVRARAYFLKYSETPISFNDGAFTANYYKADKGDTGYMVKPIDGINALFTTSTYGDGVSAISGTTGTAARKQTNGKLPISVTDGLFKDTPKIRIEVDYQGSLWKMEYVNSTSLTGASASSAGDIDLGNGWKTRIYELSDAQFGATASHTKAAVDYAYVSDKRGGWGDGRASFVLYGSDTYIKAIRVMSQDYFNNNGLHDNTAVEEFNKVASKYLNASATQADFASRNPMIHIVGDSIARTYNPPAHWDANNTKSKAADYPNLYLNEKYGWGQKLDAFLNDGIDTNNYSVAGVSTKTFGDRFDNVIAKTRKGDYVLISFGHNDSAGGDRGTTTEEYKNNLKTMCARVIEKGAVPVLITSIPSMNGVDKDSATLKSLDSDGIQDYRAAMKTLAEEIKVPVYDLAPDFYAILADSDDKTSYFSVDPKESNGTYLPDTSKLIHLSELGASTVAKLIAENLKTNVRLDAIKSYINTDVEIAHTPTIWLAGDSTCEIIEDNSTNGRKGWGMELGSFINADAAVVTNKALGGASTRSFYNNVHIWGSGSETGGKNAQLWSAIINGGEEGDFVIIQFAHNDTKDDAGVPADWLMRNTDPSSNAQNETSYRYNLKKFVAEARAKGITPVFATSIYKYTNVFGGEADNFEPYRVAMREVANELSVPVLDIAPVHKALLQTYGSEKAKILFDKMGNGSMDETHLSTTGAIEVAKMIVRAAKEGASSNEELAELVKLFDVNKDTSARAPQDGDTLK